MSAEKDAGGREIVIAGAGVIGLSLAIELRGRGHGVVVVETQQAMRQASWAAAGMLAADDPHNPPALLPLSRLSASLYPEFLRRVGELSGEAVPFQTEAVVEYAAGGERSRRAEWSLDPRQLAAALAAAARACGVRVFEGGAADDRHLLHGSVLVHASGAWFQGRQTVRPRKGQMLRVQMLADLRLDEVHRRSDVYVVPRTRGPQAGTALIGATVEDAGFDLGTREADLEQLRAKAAKLLPDFGFGDAERTPRVEAWAGLRPGTPDDLPLLGALEGRAREFVATGHFRNGILLAPATAVVLADLIEGRPGRVELTPFAPGRFLL